MSDTPPNIGGILPSNSPTPPTPEPSPSPEWFSKITDTDLRGAIQTKGWDKLEPVEAFHQAAKAHRAAEKMMGAPADHLVRLPTRDDDEQGWRQVWQRLGAPEKPEDYDLSGLDLQDADLTTRFHQTIRQAAQEANMPKAMAEKLAQAVYKFIDNTGKATDAEVTARMQMEQKTLEQDWGPRGSDRWRANEFIADQALTKLGVTKGAMDALTTSVGRAETAKLFHKIGVMMGEDKFVSGTNPTNGGVMSREQAVSRKTELMNDPQWVTRFLSGGAPEKREMTAINTMIAGA